LDLLNAALNELLETAYREIGAIEEAMLKDMSGGRLTISEMHMIEAIGREKETGRNVTDLAAELNITLPSVTMSVKKLERKGYVAKRRDSEDGRRVCVTLTRDGRRADVAHRFFHRKMARVLGNKLSIDERETLVNCLTELNAFLRQQAEQMRAKLARSGGEVDE
jgi:DNA-binding MarR family transcriptional regulator